MACLFYFIIIKLFNNEVQTLFKLVHLAFPRSGRVTSTKPKVEDNERDCTLRQWFAHNSKFDQIHALKLNRRRPWNKHFLQIVVHQHQSRPFYPDLCIFYLERLCSHPATRLCSSDAISQCNCLQKSECQQYRCIDWRDSLASFAVNDVPLHPIALADICAYRASSSPSHSAAYLHGLRLQRLQIRVPCLFGPWLVSALRIVLHRETRTPHCPHLRQHSIPKQELDCFNGGPKASHLYLHPLEVLSSIPKQSRCKT